MQLSPHLTEAGDKFTDKLADHKTYLRLSIDFLLYFRVILKFLLSKKY